MAVSYIIRAKISYVAVFWGDNFGCATANYMNFFALGLHKICNFAVCYKELPKR